MTKKTFETPGETVFYA